MKNKALLRALLLVTGIAIVSGVVFFLQRANLNTQSRASLGNSLAGKLVKATDPVCTKCVEQCPGEDNVLRSCNPMESDGSALESLCNQAGRIEVCGGKTFCCPKPGAPWTVNTSACRQMLKKTSEKKIPNGAETAKAPEPTARITPVSSVPSNFRILREGGSCTALVVDAKLAERYLGRDVVVTGSLKEPYFYVTKITLAKPTDVQPTKVKPTPSTSVYPTPSTTQYPTPTSQVPTPTSSPSSNVAPVITSSSLPVAFVGKPYNASISAIDKNYGDSLNMRIGALPSGLSQGTCAALKSGGSITCTITGTPKMSGAFQIPVTVTDNKGGIVSKIYTLSVK